MKPFEEVITKAKKARKMTHADMTTRAPKANLGMLSYGKGRMVAGQTHPGVPGHIVKALQERRKTTLTGANC